MSAGEIERKLLKTLAPLRGARINHHGFDDAAVEAH
jgi:hypothetical protein